MHMRSHSSSRVALALLAALALGACMHRGRCAPPPGERAPTPTPPAAPRAEAAPSLDERHRPTHRVVVAAPYYRDGAQQARPPEGSLVVGDIVQLLADQGSYVRIRLADGSEASVEREAIVPFGAGGGAR